MHPPSHSSASTRRHFLRWALGIGAALTLPAVSALGASSSQRTYRVQRGDTLSEIARRFGVKVRDIQQANRLKGDRILAGQSLIIPGTTPQTDALAPVIAATQKLSVDRSRWQYIVAHHSAIEQGNAEIYGSTHTRRGMENGLAYHFVIGNGIDSGDGEIEIGPRWYKQLRGGHVRSTHVNDVGIGICMVGNFENHPPTARQHASFVQLVDYLSKHCVAPDYTFTVHKWVDRNHTLCPGKHFPYQEMSRRYRA